MILRLATEADISVIIKLRNDMLRAYEENLPDDLAKSIRNYLEKHIADKSCICALAEIDGRIVSMAMLCGYEKEILAGEGVDWTTFAGTQGHVVVKVAPGGEEYRILVLDDSDQEYRVKSISQPLVSSTHF